MTCFLVVVEVFMVICIENKYMGICVTCGAHEVERFQKKDNYSVGGGSKLCGVVGME